MLLASFTISITFADRLMFRRNARIPAFNRHQKFQNSSVFGVHENDRFWQGYFGRGFLEFSGFSRRGGGSSSIEREGRRGNGELVSGPIRKLGGKQPFAEDARSQMLPTEAAIQKISERDHRSELKTSEFKSSLGSTMCFFVSFGHSL